MFGCRPVLLGEFGILEERLAAQGMYQVVSRMYPLQCLTESLIGKNIPLNNFDVPDSGKKRGNFSPRTGENADFDLPFQKFRYQCTAYETCCAKYKYFIRRRE